MNEAPREMVDRAALTELNLSIADWEQKRDADSIRHLDDIMSPDLIFRRGDMTVVGKALFMNALLGDSPFIKRETGDVSIQLVGTRAMVVLTVSVTKPDGTMARYRNVRVFFQREGAWSLEVWFNDNVTEVVGL